MRAATPSPRPPPCSVSPGPEADAVVREAKGWLKSTGVRDLEPVSLFCDQLGTDTVMAIGAARGYVHHGAQADRDQEGRRQNTSRGRPVLKPVHAVYRLQSQHFALGDRVTDGAGQRIGAIERQGRGGGSECQDEWMLCGMSRSWRGRRGR